MPFKVRIVVVAYNNENDIPECLDSLNQAFKDDFEIVVVDNSSTDRTAEIVTQRHPKVVLVRSQSNVGYAGGNNLGLNEPLPDYVVFLNPDTSSGTDWISTLLSDMEKSETVGMAQARLMLYDSQETLNSRGNDANYLMFGWPDGYGQLYVPEMSPRRIAFPSGCAFAIRREALRAVKGFDPLYFMYGEDLDLGIRGFLLGWDAIYSPRSEVFHKYRYKAAPEKFYLLERNRMITLLKTYRKMTILSMVPVILVSECGVILKSLREGWLKEKIRGYASIVANLKNILHKRSELQARRIRTDRELMELLRGGLYFSPAGDSSIVRRGNVLLEKYKLFILGLRIVDRQ